MAESNYTFGCGKLLPGYGPGNTTFVPPTSVGIPDIVDPPPDPVFACVPYLYEQKDPVVEVSPDGLFKKTTNKWILYQQCEEVGSIQWVNGFAILDSAILSYAASYNFSTMGPAVPSGQNSLYKDCSQVVCRDIVITAEKVEIIVPPVVLQPSLPVPPDGVLEDIPLTFEYLLTQPGQVDQLVVQYGDGFLDDIAVGPTDTLLESTHTYSLPGDYTLTATALLSGDVVTSEVLDITVLPQVVPTLSISIDSDGDLLAGSLSDFVFTLSQPGLIDTLEVTYSNGTVNTISNIGPQITTLIDQAEFVEAGEITVSVVGTNDNSIIATAEKTFDVIDNPISITIRATPQSSIGLPPLTYEPGTDVTYTALLTGTTGAIFTWILDGDTLNVKIGNPLLPSEIPSSFSDNIGEHSLQCTALIGGNPVATKSITTTVVLG